MTWFLNEIYSASAGVKRIDRSRSYSRAFEFYSDDPSGADKRGLLAARSALLSVGIGVGAAFVDGIDGTPDYSAVCTAIEAVQDPDAVYGTKWLLTATYEARGRPPRPDEPLDSLEDHPLSRPPSIRGAVTHVERVMHQARYIGAYKVQSGSVVVAADYAASVTTSAREPILDLPSYDGSSAEWDVTVNLDESSWSAEIAGRWANAVNSSEWNGLPAYTVRVTDLSWHRIWEPPGEGFAGLYYYQVSYRLSYKADYWYFRFPDEGTQQLHATGTVDSNRGADGSLVVLHLNGQGERLDDQDDESEYVELRFLPLEWSARDFALIPGGPFTL